MTLTAYTYCSFCGQSFDTGQSWPRRCGHCGNTTYRNPLPVAVILVPIGAGVLLIRRAIPPRQGLLGLPGGYIGLGESWQQAGAREVWEETGVTVDPATITDLHTRSAPDGTVLVFGVSAPLAPEALPPFAATSETSERLVTDVPLELAFSLHTDALRYFFELRSDR
jgi:ADP-ribose pyrophosphatase YjhB (NUDIX family)